MVFASVSKGRRCGPVCIEVIFPRLHHDAKNLEHTHIAEAGPHQHSVESTVATYYLVDSKTGWANNLYTNLIASLRYGHVVIQALLALIATTFWHAQSRVPAEDRDIHVMMFHES